MRENKESSGAEQRSVIFKGRYLQWDIHRSCKVKLPNITVKRHQSEEWGGLLSNKPELNY